MNDILKHRAMVAQRISGQFSDIRKAEVDEIEKAKWNDGDMHPNGKWVWRQSANGGKGDWRVANPGKRGSAAKSSPAPSSSTAKKDVSNSAQSASKKQDSTVSKKPRIRTGLDYIESWDIVGKLKRAKNDRFAAHEVAEMLEKRVNDSLSGFSDKKVRFISENDWKGVYSGMVIIHNKNNSIDSKFSFEFEPKAVSRALNLVFNTFSSKGWKPKNDYSKINDENGGGNN